MAHEKHGSGAVDQLIGRAPMPLAQLARRARNAKTGAAVLQNAAHYLAEASAALAASYWLGRALAKNGKPTPAMQAQLRNMLTRGASFGSWVGLCREAAALAGGLAGLASKLGDVAPLDQLHTALKQQAPRLGQDGDELVASLGRARKRGVLGFLEFLASFRNKIYGHGAMLPEAVCRELAGPFLTAVSHVIRQPILFDGDWLGRSALDVLQPDQPRHWVRLEGISERRGPADATTPSASDHPEAGLCFVGEGRVTTLSFWVLQDEDATGLSRFGFFQKAPAKRGKKPLVFKTIEYLDYLSGRFRDDRGRAALQNRAAELLGDDADKGSGETATTSDEQAMDVASANERRFGDFIIESELGRGAMGIVYRARQLALGRQVALKVLPPALLSDAVALGRFHREVQALARCDHPNVVRVLASGVEQSRPWFAMELVEGADLAELFDTLTCWKGTSPLRAGHLSAASASLRDRRHDTDPSASVAATDPAIGEIPLEAPDSPTLDALDNGRRYYQRLAELFAEAADGVEEIHSRGVLHRDIKPANLMLSSDGQRLVVMDLGLAKVSDASVSYTSAGGSDFVGSARYAAPEQLQAKLLKVDHRADVYSLAATLYELTTLKTLYPAAEIGALLQQKLNEDPLPARQLAGDVPRDLETILQKALARRPDDRYRAAADFASDLRAFAESRPIRARPPSAFEYLRLFYTRQRRLVAVMGAATALLIAVVIGSFVLVNEERRNAIAERDRAAKERDRAAQERDRAEGLAIFIADEVYSRLEPIGRLDLLGRVSDRMVEHYASRPGDDPAIALRHAEAVLRAAQVRHLQGAVEPARMGYERALTMLDVLHKQPDADPQVDVALARALHYMAGVHFNQNDLDAAFAKAQRALALRSALATNAPREPAYQRDLAQSERLQGVVLERRGKSKEAFAAYRRALEIGLALTQRDPNDLAAQIECGRNHQNVGALLETTGKLKEAARHYHGALGAFAIVSASEPGNVMVTRQVATCHDSIARIHRKQGDAAAALESYDKARVLREGLVQFDPTRAGWQRDLSASYGEIGFLAAQQQQLDRARASYKKGLLISQRLVKRDSSNVRWQMDVAVGQANLAGILERQGELAAARKQLQISLATRKETVSRDPSNTEYRHQLAVGHCLLAGVLAKQAELKRAQVEARACISEFETITAQDSNNVGWRDQLATARKQLAETVAQGERTAAAARLAQEPLISRSRKGESYE